MSTNEQAEHTDQGIRSLVSDEEAKDIARSVYLTMPVVRLLTISKRCGRTKEQVERWRDEGNWLHERDILKKDKQAKVIELSGDAKQAHGEALIICKNIREFLLKRTKAMAESRTYVQPDEARTYAEVLSKIYSTQASAYKALGIDPFQ